MAIKSAFPFGKSPKTPHWSLLNLDAVDRTLDDVRVNQPDYPAFKAFCIEVRQCRYDLAHLSRRSGIFFAPEAKWLLAKTDWVISRLEKHPGTEKHEQILGALKWHRDELAEYMHAGGVDAASAMAVAAEG